MARHMHFLLVMPLLVAVAMGSVAQMVQGNPAPGPAALVCPSEFVEHEDKKVLHATTSVGFRYRTACA